MTKPKFYVTTPIYYINDVPHVGHAYSTIAADVLARYWRGKLGDSNVFLLTGTDENSKKTIEAAKAVGQEIQEYTDQTAKKWEAIWKQLGITNNGFIRTTEPAHVKAVQDVILKIHEAGDIEKGVYEGPYCFKCEAFYREDELIDGCCPIHKTEVEHLKEENYFFKLSKYQDQLKQYITDNPHFVEPESRRNEVSAFIDRGLEDVSISRASQKWGIKLPFDESQIIYVWFDALINYLTGVGYPDDKYKEFWPANVHIVGKDIIKFHCIIWPAMLMSAGLELPQKVFAHGFFTIDGEKISKSLGNAIDPVELANKYGNDALRYFLLREIPFGADGDFSRERFKIVYETELGNKLGNLVTRTAAMLNKYCDGSFEKINPAKPLALEDDIEKLKFEQYLQKIFVRIEELNTSIEENKPWELVKTEPGKVKDVLSGIVSELVELSKWLEPVIPEATAKIQKTFMGGKVDSSVGILFPRVEE
ncbi:methionine--tRNA ligase [Candidatus Saccharibacteria bacterium]|nr:methionine--tRNA ligase [Candidatus Saccharibacteria bacterium]